MKVDTYKVSLVWGRIGATVCGLLAMTLSLFDIKLTADEQAGLTDAVTGVLAGMSGILAFISKLRETYRMRK